MNVTKSKTKSSFFRTRKKSYVDKKLLKAVLNSYLSNTKLSLCSVYVFDTTRTIEVVLVWLFGKMTIVVNDENRVIKTKYHKGSLPFTDDAITRIHKNIVCSIIDAKSKTK